MITSKGRAYKTIADAVPELGVSAKTIRDYIQQHIIDPPPEIEYGVRTMWHFPPEYIDKAKEQIRRYREKRNAARNRNGQRHSKQ